MHSKSIQAIKHLHKARELAKSLDNPFKGLTKEEIINPEACTTPPQLGGVGALLGMEPFKQKKAHQKSRREKQGTTGMPVGFHKVG